jgi:hypothetical protein
MPHHFRVGDRVRLVEALADLANDQLGTVTQTYPAPGVYAVQFDGETWSRIVTGALLTDAPGHTHGVQELMTFRSE